MKAIKQTARKAWSDDDIHRCIDLYDKFLFMQQTGVPYQKAGPVRDLAKELDRTKGSIEAKLMNISGVRDQLGLEYIDGYKPLYNYQKRLGELVRIMLGVAA